MQLPPNITERLARARSDLRMGVPIILEDGANGAVLLATETATSERFMALKDIGNVELAITSRRAETLKARVYQNDIAHIVIPDECDLAWAKSVADPSDDLMSPLKGPLTSVRQCSAQIAQGGVILCKSARLLPSALVLSISDPTGFAAENNLTRVPVQNVLDLETSPHHPVVNARLPMALAEHGRLHIFRPEDGGEEHYAVEIGRPDRDKPILSRLHSACFTGDVLGSLKCDCGPQLNAALAQMGTEGEGVLLYLNQEGRGIGLANKMRAYSLQDQGFDTVEANHRLGFEDDERDFRIGANILREMGFSQVRLLTNNPNKVARMNDAGLTVVERVPLQVGLNEYNENYLATKAKKSGHLL